MPPASSRIFTDGAVSSAVLDLIREAKEYVVIVSPYNRFWGHLKDDLHLAIQQRKVRVVAFYRSGEDVGDIPWLVNEGATAYAVPYLHAKLYLSESSVLLTSMNLTRGEYSLEVGVQVDEPGATELRNYAKQRLMGLGTKFDPATAAAQTPPIREHREPREPSRESPTRDRVIRTRDSVMGKIKGTITTIRANVVGGKCVRCNAPISFNTARPLCEEHFKEWDRFKNPNYVERYCHKCGRDWQTTFAKPLCIHCFTASGPSRPPFGRRGFASDTEPAAEDTSTPPA